MKLIELKKLVDELINNGNGNLNVVYPSPPYGEDDDVNDLILTKKTPIYLDTHEMVISIC